MKKTLIIMTATVLLLAQLVTFRGGTALLWQGLLAGLLLFVNVLPLLLAAFALSGLIQALINQQKISRLLGKGSGFKGILLGATMGGDYSWRTVCLLPHSSVPGCCRRRSSCYYGLCGG